MAKRTGEPICARVKADNPELCSRGVHRAHLVMHDFGVRGFYLGCKQSTTVASVTNWAHPGPDPWDGLSLPCRSGCNLQHNRKKRPVCAGCHTSRPALEVLTYVTAQEGPP